MLKSIFRLFFGSQLKVSKMKMISCSPSNADYFRTGYPAKHNWEINAQCGGNIKNKFFFEAFPEFGFIRADSKVSMEDAEEKAWMKYQQILNCKADHKNPDNLDRRDYKNGCSFCKSCNGFISSSFSNLQPTTICQVCKNPTYYTKTNDGLWCCDTCIDSIPDFRLYNHQLDKRYKRGIFSPEYEAALDKLTDEDIESVITHISQTLKNEK